MSQLPASPQHPAPCPHRPVASPHYPVPSPAAQDVVITTLASGTALREGNQEDIPASVIGKNINVLKQQRDEYAKDFKDIEIFTDSNEDSDPDVDDECQLWNEEKKKK